MAEASVVGAEQPAAWRERARAPRQRLSGSVLLALALAGSPASTRAQDALNYGSQPPPEPPGTEVPSDSPPAQPFVPRRARAQGAPPDPAAGPPPAAAPIGPHDPATDTRIPSSSPFPPAPPPHAPPTAPYATPETAIPDTTQAPPPAEPTPPPLTADIPTTPIGSPGPAPDTTLRIQAAVMFGLGATFDHTLGGVNPLGFGFGLRGSYRLLDQLSVGGRVMYFVGGSSELPSGQYAMQSWLLAGEAAYPVVLDDVLFQPGVAFGIMFRDTDGRPGYIGNTGGGYIVGSSDRTEAGFYFAPGLNVVFPLTLIDRDLSMFFLGGDTRLDLVFGSGVTANVQLLIQGGLRF